MTTETVVESRLNIMYSTRTFDADEQKIFIEELNKLQIDWLNCLADDDENETVRTRLFTLSYLKNAIIAGYLNKLPITFDDTICVVNIDE